MSVTLSPQPALSSSRNRPVPATRARGRWRPEQANDPGSFLGRQRHKRHGGQMKLVGSAGAKPIQEDARAGQLDALHGC